MAIATNRLERVRFNRANDLPDPERTAERFAHAPAHFTQPDAVRRLVRAVQNPWVSQ